MSDHLSYWIAGSIVLITAVIIWFKEWAIGQTHRLPSGVQRAPGAVPILGHLFHALKHYEKTLDEIGSLPTRAGRSVSYHLPFSAPFVFVGNPKVIEYVMKTKFESFEKHRFFGDRVQELLGRGIFNADGHEWKMQRKTAANIFSVKNFKDFTGSVFVDELALLEKRLAKAIDNKETVDFHDLFHRFTLDGFGKIGFGIELDCMSKDKVPFALAFDRCQSKIDVRFFNPFWQIEEFFNVWKKMELKKDIKTIREFALGIITSRKAESEEQMNQRSDLLTYFLKLRGENGEQLSDQILTDYVLNFIIAGRDTTAQALSWCIYELSLNPNVKQKLMDEIETTLQGRAPTYEEIKGMKYANAVFNETLRLHPSVPKNAKQCVKDEVLPDGTPIPKGTVISWCPYAAGRDTKIWGPDAEQFDPERWMDPTKTYSQFEFPAFNVGPRVCLGKALAELEAVFVLVSLMGKYKVIVVSGQNITYGNSLTLPMRHGIKCTVEHR